MKLNCASLAAYIHPAPTLSHSKQTAASWETEIKPYAGKLILNLKVLKVRLQRNLTHLEA